MPPLAENIIRTRARSNALPEHARYRDELAHGVAFVFVIGLFFAWVVMETGSIPGVTLSHGITNIGLLLVIPFLL